MRRKINIQHLLRSKKWKMKIVNNYSPKWRLLAVDIYRAPKERCKHPPLATDTKVNSCFSIH